jgi:hypothetical protein
MVERGDQGDQISTPGATMLGFNTSATGVAVGDNCRSGTPK